MQSLEMRLSVAALVAAFGLVAIPRAEATVMVPLSIEEMAKEAVAVVRAEVVEQHAEWDEAKKRIYTHTTLEVIDPVVRRAEISPRIVVRTLGGELDGVGMKVAGEARFSVGEKVFVFLNKDGGERASFRVIGMSQGKYRLVQDPTGRWMAEPSLEGVAFAKKDSTGVLRVDETPPPLGRLGLTELRARVIAAADSTKVVPTAPPNPTAPTLPHGPSPDKTTTP